MGDFAGMPEGGINITEIVSISVTLAAVVFGLIAGLWAYRLTAGARAAQALWRKRSRELEDRIARADGVFGAFPGLVLVWDEVPELEDGKLDGWGRPRIFGSPTALASLLKFAEASEGPDPAGLLLEGVADYEARSAGGTDTTLRRRFAELIADGRPFSMTIIGPEGRFLEADARAAGTQLVVWLSDATIRGLDESEARGRVEDARRQLEADPIAILDTLERAPYPSWRMNATGRIVWANAAYARAVEVETPAEVLDKQIALEPAIRDLAMEAAKSGEAVSALKPVVVEGSRRALDLVSFPISGGAAGFALDVTDGEEAKTALKRFRRAFDDTLDQLAEAVAVFDRGQKMVFRNTAFDNLFGLDRQMLDNRPGHGEMLDRLREARKIPEQADYAGWKKAELARYDDAPDAEIPDELWNLPDVRTLRVARQRNPLGGLLMVFEDKTYELALRSRYNTLINVQRATLDKLHEAVAVFGSDGRLRLHNSEFERLWNLEAAELDGQPELEIVAEKCSALFDNPGVWADMKARVADPSPEARRHVTGEMEREDGKVLVWLSRPLPDGATLIAWQDVTDSRRIEEALRERAEALEASERIKGEFVEHVSYQLRTPLTTITGYADMILQGIAGELSDQQKNYLGYVRSAADELEKMVTDILDVAAIDAGQLELDPTDVDLKALASDAVELLASKAEHAGVRLAVNAPSGEAVITGDAKRLRQITVNLLSNALNHTPRDGRITLTVKRDEDGASITVSDTGEGISPDRQARVFERFERGQRGGAGLGLALVKEIVEMHGGWVDLASEPEKGTTVVCHLPAIAKIDAAPELDLTGLLRPDGEKAAADG